MNEHGNIGTRGRQAGKPPVEREPEAYDDEQDHIRCPDCKGSGYYVGFLERSYCATCDGSGYL